MFRFLEHNDTYFALRNKNINNQIQTTMKNKTLLLRSLRQMAAGLSVSAALMCIIPLIAGSLTYGGLFAPVLILLSCILMIVAERGMRYLFTRLMVRMVCRRSKIVLHTKSFNGMQLRFSLEGA